MQAEDATGPPRQADLDAIVELVVAIASEHRALAGEFEALVDITRSLVATQSDLIGIVESLQAEITQPLDDVLDLDDRLGALNQARQARSQSTALVERAGALVTQARALNADVAGILKTPYGNGHVVVTRGDAPAGEGLPSG